MELIFPSEGEKLYTWKQIAVFMGVGLLLVLLALLTTL